LASGRRPVLERQGAIRGQGSGTRHFQRARIGSSVTEPERCRIGRSRRKSRHGGNSETRFHSGGCCFSTGVRQFGARDS
jgi:hypothetical protein